MKVAYLVNQYPLASLTFVRREIAALERLGVEVSRMAVRTTPVTDPADRAEAIKTHVVLQTGIIGLTMAVLYAACFRPKRFLQAARLAWQFARDSRRGWLVHIAYFIEACAIARRLNREGVRHIHAHFGTNSAAVAALAAALSGASYSFTVHGPEEFDRPESLSLGRKIERAAFVVAVSDFGRSQLMRWSRVGDWPKLQVVHCGLDEGYFPNEPSPPADAPRVLCIGRMVEQKGQHVLVEAVARLRDLGIPIQARIVGDGTLRSLIETRIRELRLDEQVTLVGWLDEAEVRAELLAARALVMPSFAEGLPVTIMEALALGRPVVTTYIAGIPELVIHDECGWLVPAGSAAALADALRECLAASSEKMLHMGRCGAARSRQRHSASCEAAKLAGHFQRVLAGDESR